MSGKIVADADMAESLYHRGRGYSHPAVKIFMPAGANEPVYGPYTEMAVPRDECRAGRRGYGSASSGLECDTDPCLNQREPALLRCSVKGPGRRRAKP